MDNSNTPKQDITQKPVKQMALFCLLSASAGLIQIASFSMLNELLTLPYWPSYLVSLVLSVLWNFTLNRKFTFKGANNISIAMLKVFAFYLVFTPVSTVLGEICTQSGINEYLVLGVTMVTNMVTEFLYCKFFVYRNNEKANTTATEQTESTTTDSENN